MQIFFNTDSLSQFFSTNVNLHNLNEKVLINNDINNFNNNNLNNLNNNNSDNNLQLQIKNNSDYKTKIMSTKIFIFHKILKGDDIDRLLDTMPKRRIRKLQAYNRIQRIPHRSFQHVFGHVHQKP